MTIITVSALKTGTSLFGVTEEQNRPSKKPCNLHLHVKILAEGSFPGKYGFYSNSLKMDCKTTTTTQDSNTFSHH